LKVLSKAERGNGATAVAPIALGIRANASTLIEAGILSYEKGTSLLRSSGVMPKNFGCPLAPARSQL
jgi:hypothetical protein